MSGSGAIVGGERPTLREVAERAGVSPMTVSRTLNGGKSVRPEVQAKVWAAVRDLGYFRNENARSLRPGQSSGLVGIAITNLANPYYASFALGVEEIAFTHGAQILLGNTAEDLGREKELISGFLGRQVDGLIVVPTGVEHAHLQADRLGGVPLVLASRTVPGLDVDAALIDDVNGAYLATKTLLDNGHRRIGFLGNLVSVFTAGRRYSGYLKALREYGLDEDPMLVRHGQQDPASAQLAMESLLNLADPPTGVFSANNRNTVGALQAVARRMAFGQGRPVPAIAGFDDIELSDLIPVPLFVVGHDPRELGRQAAMMLYERMAQADLPVAERMPPRVIELPTFLR